MQENERKKLLIAYDMETGDPDDYFNLIMLCSHPKVEIKCITLTPGSKDQILFLQFILQKLISLGYVHLKNVKIGAFNSNHPKKCLSRFLVNLFPEFSQIYKDTFENENNSLQKDDIPFGYDIMFETYNEFKKDLIFVTGAPLSNLGTFLQKYENQIDFINKIVIQGGFAGDNVVPEHLRLKKFEGNTMISTYNFGGNVKAAKFVLNFKKVGQRLLVSKNVCHGVVYNEKIHLQLSQHIQNLENDVNSNTYLEGLKLIYSGMSTYLERHKEGKKFHDVLAGCVAIDPMICQFKRVQVLEEKNKWGSKESTEGNTWITISVDKERFFNLMMDRVNL
ncbi:hypothetical protein ABK040_013523 [Willaertia magna]